MSSELPSVRVICWSNGQPLPSGAGYGVRLSSLDRDDVFDPGWPDVIVSLDQGENGLRGAVEVVLAVLSFEALLLAAGFSAIASRRGHGDCLLRCCCAM